MRRSYGEADKDNKIKIIDVLDAEPVEPVPRMFSCVRCAE